MDLDPEFTPTSRQALAWVLWHHQGGSSPVGQAIRFALGMGQHERMPDWMVADAKKWGELRLHRRHDDAVKEAAQHAFGMTSDAVDRLRERQCRLGRGCQPNPDCQDRHQCWEPCGELGKSAEHAVPVREIRPVACTDQVRFCAHCGFGPCEKRTVTAGRFGPIAVRTGPCPDCGSPPGVHALSCKNWAGSTDHNWRQR